MVGADGAGPETFEPMAEKAGLAGVDTLDRFAEEGWPLV